MTPTSQAPLQRLETILEQEATALRTLDVAGIDKAARAKEALEAELAHILHAPLSPSDAELLPRLRERARSNQIRLAATLSSVRGLVAALTSDAQPSYGPQAPTAGTKPVLTSVVG